ncbi:MULTISPECIES: hypothetical protein [Dickeya]|uniref:hypothetical protein n=1 Tax=Dickeya TaxID=204037 RepID=UPI001CE61DFE|nr:hypothetical protein FGI04_15425 [Dickeya zeae]
MKWIKKGLICSFESFDLEWYKKNTMVPVPLLISKDCLRIFLTMCDAENVGRIGYVDVNPNNPSEIINYSKEAVLDIGRDGCFDDSGVLPSAIFEHEGKHYMFYSAYQKQTKIPYTILTGVAVFNNDFTKLERVTEVPLLERTDDERFIRSAVFCIKDQEKFKIYYSSGNEWVDNTLKIVPRYDIKCIESDDLLDWHKSEPKPCISLSGDEYGLTTPNVYKDGNIYKMTYAIRSISKGYRLGYAESTDGIHWQRIDNLMDIEVSPSGWDSEMVCFGNVFQYEEKEYLFYCGNHYGIGGMGYAELMKNEI